ncbi:MAG: SMC family ATPase [Motiliproteus sp.]
MRPIILTMSAFGPFPGREQVDFRAMGETPLFLINGPTGSGKTTILDAICFALYGKTTGDEREGSQMRADLAAPEQLTEVTLVFELAGKYYRIRRVPEQQKPKARGEGSTTQSPEAQLWLLQGPDSNSPDQEQLLVPAKVTEATATIEKLTGLNADQFRQVMVLPQGKFRQLLMAESKDREMIFSQLFQTHIYKQLEDKLKSRAANVRQQREQQQQLMAGILEGCSLESELALQQELQLLQPQWQQLSAENKQCSADSQQATTELQAATQLNQAFAQLSQTQGAIQQQQQQAESMDKQRQQLQQAESARQIQPRFDQLQNQRQQQLQLEAQRQQLRSDQQQADRQLEFAKQQSEGCPALEQQLDASKQRLVQMQSYRNRAAELDQARQHSQQAAQLLATATGQTDQIQSALSVLLTDKEQAEQRYQQLQQGQLQFPEKQSRLNLLESALQLATERDASHAQQFKLEQQLVSAEERGKQLNSRYQQSKQQALELELQWHQGQAAVLAQTLKKDQPCPVCGSCQHPDPHQTEQHIPSQQQLQQARQQTEQDHQQLLEAREQYQALSKDRQHLQQQLGEIERKLTEFMPGPVDRVTLKTEQVELQQQLQVLLANQQELIQLTRQFESIKGQEQAQRQQLQQQQTQLTEQQSQSAATDVRLQQAEAELPQEFRHSGSLEQAITAVESEINQQQAAIDQARQQYQRASDNWHQISARLGSCDEQLKQLKLQCQAAEKLWVQQLQDSAFVSQEDFLAAQLSEPQRQALKQNIRDYDHRCAELRGALEQQQQTLAGKSNADLGRYEKLLQQAEAHKTEAENRWQEADRRLLRLQDTADKLQQAHQQQSGIDEQYKLLGTLSDVANGQTGNKISLQRFVLSVLLDDVLIEASRRLQLMSKGRYQLWRKEQRAKGNKASGLELQVEDAYTGNVRPVATLSGGESFMAALSMALGLSDVVQAYSGGIRLDTLFVDEGFGSLDPESLDLAVRTLTDLRASGRMVGIISHVSELKEQISMRLDVVADRAGSRIQPVLS